MTILARVDILDLTSNVLHLMEKRMKTLGASEAKNRFGELLDLARREPIQISKKGRNVVVVLSVEEFERLSELENELLAFKAEKAQREGFIGESESEALLEKLLNA